MKIVNVFGALVFASAMASMLPLAAAAQGAPGSLESQVKQLQDEVQVLKDKEEITRLDMEYGRTLDSGDYVGYGNLFAKNGTWGGRYTGPAQIADVMTKTYKTTYNIPDGAFHMFTNLEIDVHGDTATGLVKWHFVVPGPNGTSTILKHGVYRDQYIREDGVWKFFKR